MSTNKIIAELDAEQMTREVPEFAPGDTVVIQVRVKEGTRERLQAFEGVCIGKRNRGLNSAFWSPIMRRSRSPITTRSATPPRRSWRLARTTRAAR